MYLAMIMQEKQKLWKKKFQIRRIRFYSATVTSSCSCPGHFSTKL